MLLLLGQLAVMIELDARAVSYPFELDYGEGVVWQQMRLILARDGYGPIDQFPAIVFHYPPLYHVLAGALSAASGWDELASGRIVSVIATSLVMVFAGVIVFRALAGNSGWFAAIICAVISALSIASFVPVQLSSTLMRVDMAALAFSFAGVLFGLQALMRPRLVHLAALCFVASVFTKQTAIAAPAATFFVLLILRPKTGLAGVVTSLLLGASILATLGLVTREGILRHLFLYNINRLDASNLAGLLTLAAYVGYIYVAIRGVPSTLRGWTSVAKEGAAGYVALREQLAHSAYESTLLLFIFYFAIATPMLLMILKAGASINYFVEWTCVLSVLVGLYLREAAMTALARNNGDRPPTMATIPIPPLLIAVVVAIQAALLTLGRNASSLWPARDPVELTELVGKIAEAPRPVISDDMVLVLRAGKSIAWEPAIFGELARSGIWNERPFIDMINSHDFAFFLTDGDEGYGRFDLRYTPAVAEAIRKAYPAKRRIAGYVLHLESGSREN
jgi:hypothetical protein